MLHKIAVFPNSILQSSSVIFFSKEVKREDKGNEKGRGLTWKRAQGFH